MRSAGARAAGSSASGGDSPRLRAATSRLLLLAALAAAPLQAQLVAQAIPAVPRVEGTSRARLRNLTTLLDDYVAQGKLAGGVLRVQRHGQVV